MPRERRSRLPRGPQRRSGNEGGGALARPAAFSPTNWLRRPELLQPLFLRLLACSGFRFTDSELRRKGRMTPHQRETIAFSKRRQSAIERLAALQVWRNVFKPLSERRRDSLAAAEHLGLCERKLEVAEVPEQRLLPSLVRLPERLERYYRREALTRRIANGVRRWLRYADQTKRRGAHRSPRRLLSDTILRARPTSCRACPSRDRRRPGSREPEGRRRSSSRALEAGCRAPARSAEARPGGSR